jgi:hypothetical protein
MCTSSDWMSQAQALLWHAQHRDHEARRQSRGKSGAYMASRQMACSEAAGAADIDAASSLGEATSVLHAPGTDCACMSARRAVPRSCRATAAPASRHARTSMPAPRDAGRWQASSMAAGAQAHACLPNRTTWGLMHQHHCHHACTQDDALAVRLLQCAPCKGTPAPL